MLALDAEDYIAYLSQFHYRSRKLILEGFSFYKFFNLTPTISPPQPAILK